MHPFPVAEPSGKPRVTAAHNTSSTSLYIAWQPPERKSVHGDFLGYRLSFRPRDVDETKATVVPIEDPSLTVRRDEGQATLPEGRGGRGGDESATPIALLLIYAYICDPVSLLYWRPSRIAMHCNSGRSGSSMPVREPIHRHVNPINDTVSALKL